MATHHWRKCRNADPRRGGEIMDVLLIENGPDTLAESIVASVASPKKDAVLSVGWLLSPDTADFVFSVIRQAQHHMTNVCRACETGTECVFMGKFGAEFTRIGIIAMVHEWSGRSAFIGDPDEFARRLQAQGRLNDYVKRMPRRGRTVNVDLYPQGVRAAAKLLKVKLPANEERIRKAYKKAALEAHPDRGGTDAKMREINAARDLLLDEFR